MRAARAASSRREFLRLTLQVAAAGAAIPVLAACNNSSASQDIGPLPTPVVNDPNDPRNKHFSMIDSFYTLDNDYFQGWARGSAFAAATLLMSRDQQVDNSNIDVLRSVFEAAPIKDIQGVSTLPNTAAASPEILGLAQASGIYASSNWSNAPWSTPFDIGDYYYSFQTANDVAGARELCKLLFTEMGGKGKFIHIEGNKGNSASDNRTAGVDEALALFPGIQMVARQPGGFSRGGTQPVIENLLTANPDVTGIMCANDDSAMAAVTAVESRGIKNCKVVGIDAIREFLEAIPRGTAFATWAHHGAWIGAFSTVRVFDALAGVKLSAPERMMNFGGFIIDSPESAAAYADLMYSSKPLPFDYEKMSRALHPDDWDPQNSMIPLDIDVYWKRDSKPPRYTLPKQYTDAVDNGDMERVAQRYAAALTTDPFASVRSKCRNGGKDILQ